MTEQAPQETNQEQFNRQVDQYLEDQSIHIGGSVHGNGGDIHSHMIPGGSVSRNIDHRGRTDRILSVERNVDGQHLASDVVTWGYGDLPTHVERASTSDDKSRYSTWAERTAAVGRDTESGERYTHVFKDPAKVKRASELITGLASKRAARIVEGKRSQKAA